MRQRWVIAGRVQGVGFRWWTAAQAERLGLRGWCRNLPDGSVEVEAEGAPDAIAELGTLLGSGPPGAAVNACVKHPAGAAPITASGFVIRH